MPDNSSTLPYTDTKDVGAADFYFGINATFRFIRERFQMEGLRRYWQAMGREYFRPVTERWKSGGTVAVAKYWRAFFDAEPGSAVTISSCEDKVVIDVHICPMISHLRKNGREIIGEFCQHCFYVSDAMGEGAGIAARISGGNGQCRQEFVPRAGAPGQDLEEIVSCA